MGGLRKSDTLRGYGRFRNVIANGQRIEGALLRCYVLWRPQLSLDVHFGIVVPSKRYRATRRNRLKRLIRESIAAHRADWMAALGREGTVCEMIVYYKGSEALIPERARLKDVHDDLEQIRSTIVRKKL